MKLHSDNMMRPLIGIAISLIIMSAAGCGNSGPSGKAASAAEPPNIADAPPILRKWCSDCHAPPSPKSHTSQEWPNVVARMQTHRSMQGLANISNQDLKNLINYLESHAKS